MTTDEKRHFFISFTGADRPWARWLARVLGEEGYTYWFQDQDFAGSIPGNIENAQAQSQRTIVLLSEAYARSDYCRSEWEMRYQDDPGGANDLIIPFRLGPCDLGPLLGRLAYSDLFTCQDEDSAREEVRQRLRQAVEPGYRRPLAGGEWPGPRPASAPFPVPDHNLPRLTSGFVGRTDELEALHKALAGTGRTTITQAIIGLGGIGKTQLALHYAYGHLADYDVIRWLRAEEPATLAADYTSLAAALRLEADAPDQDALIAAIRRRLELTPRWLLIFDNATTPASLDPYLPTLGRGHVIVTSRHQDWSDAAQPLELSLLPEADAVAFLMEGQSDDSQREAAAGLAQELDRLPLALAQARAFMRARRISVADYRQQFASMRPEVMRWWREDAPYPRPVAQAWQASVEAAGRDCPAAPALLELLAFLAPDAIPRDILEVRPIAAPERGLVTKLVTMVRGWSAAKPRPLAPDHLAAFERDTAIEALARYSLIRAEPATLAVHRLIQAVTRHGLDETRARGRAEAAVQLLEAAWPGPPWEHTLWPRIADLLPHVLTCTSHAEQLRIALPTTASLLNSSSMYFRARAAWAQAEPLYQRAIAILEKTLPPSHPNLRAGRRNYAGLLDQLGRTHEAAALRTLADAAGR